MIFKLIMICGAWLIIFECDPGVCLLSRLSLCSAPQLTSHLLCGGSPPAFLNSHAEYSGSAFQANVHLCKVRLL